MNSLIRIAAATILAVLVTLMVGPFGEIEGRTGIWDKGAHFLAFGVILLCFGALFSRIPRAALAVGSVALGGLVEVVQGLTGRDASWGDLLADALGAAAVFVIWAGWRHFGPRSARQTLKTR